MILTIGSLVQETSNRSRWVRSASLYTVSATGSSAAVGAGLAWLGGAVHPTALRGGGYWVVGALALAYALSDVGWLVLPRPRIWFAVPITWWRRWQPYWAAVAYGAALGTGVMTQVSFGAFYVLCAWCFFVGDPAYGAALLGTYGLARALTIFPASWAAFRHRHALDEWLDGPLFSVSRAHLVVAISLAVFGATLLVPATIALLRS